MPNSVANYAKVCQILPNFAENPTFYFLGKRHRKKCEVQMTDIFE